MAAARALLRRLRHVVVELARLGQLQQHRLEQAIVGVGDALGGGLDVAGEALVLVASPARRRGRASGAKSPR